MSEQAILANVDRYRRVVALTALKHARRLGS